VCLTTSLPCDLEPIYWVSVVTEALGLEVRAVDNNRVDLFKERPLTNLSAVLGTEIE
jgi:hypothetical protein